MYLSTAYLGNQHYYTKLLSGKARIDLHENYQKQSYRNRCTILSGNGPIDLIVPVLQPSGIKIQTKDIRIDPSKKWRHQHWNAITSAYQNSPYFEHYEPELAPFYQRSYDFLAELNEALQAKLLDFLSGNVKVTFTDEYATDVRAAEDFRMCISPKPRLQRSDPSFTPPRYYQVFSEHYAFVPNLSVLDLLFCEGPHAKQMLAEASR